MDSTAVAYTVIGVGTLIFLAHLFALFFSKKQIPDVLLLLIIGLIIGPVCNFAEPENFGIVGPIFFSITLVVMLFDGGVDMNWRTLREAWRGTLVITFTCFISLLLVIGTVAWLLIGLNPWAAYLLGAILGGTSSAVVIPLVKHFSVSKDTSIILILESAITDVLCIVVAVAFMESFKASDTTPSVMKIFGTILSSFILATIIGGIAGILWSSVLHKVRTITTGMFLTPAFVFIVFGVTESLGFSGAIAALVFGICLGNCKDIHLPRYKYEPKQLNENELNFIREIVFILKTFFFVFVGISISFDNLQALLWGIIIVLFVFITRLIVTRMCAPVSASTFDKTIISFMIPKGLAAAVLASIPETIPNFPNGTEIKNITYAVVLFSILLTSVMILVISRFPKANRWYGIFFNNKISDITSKSHSLSTNQEDSHLPPETK